MRSSAALLLALAARCEAALVLSRAGRPMTQFRSAAEAASVATCPRAGFPIMQYNSAEEAAKAADEAKSQVRACVELKS